MTKKQTQAHAILTEATAAGCAPSIQNGWVVFTPPLPMHLMLQAAQCGDELAALVKPSQKVST